MAQANQDVIHQPGAILNPNLSSVVRVGDMRYLSGQVGTAVAGLVINSKTEVECLALASGPDF